MALYLDGERVLGNGYDYGSEMPMSPNNNNKVADEIDGKVDTANFYGKLLPMSTTDTDKVADRIEACETAISGIPIIKSVLLSGTINCNTADANTIGYRNTDANKVILTTRTGYPTGKTIIAYVVEKACITGNSNQGAIAVIDETILNCNCKINSICDWAVRVVYVD